MSALAHQPGLRNWRERRRLSSVTAIVRELKAIRAEQRQLTTRAFKRAALGGSAMQVGEF